MGCGSAVAKNGEAYKPGEESESLPLAASDPRSRGSAPSQAHASKNNATCEPPKRSSVPEERSPRGQSKERSPRSPSKDESVRSASKELADVSFHTQHCSKKDFFMYYSIRDAYPFDDANVALVVKSTRSSLGSARVPKVPIKKIFCNSCGVFITDRTGKTPFHACRNCKQNGHKYELCVSCFGGGRSPSVTPRKSCPVAKEREVAAATRLQAFQRGRSARKLVAEERAARHVWKGTITEDQFTRDVEFSISFARGEVNGIGPDFSMVSGHCRGGHISWEEKHDWGKVSVTGKIDNGEISGDIIFSDGGKGKILLRRKGQKGASAPAVRVSGVKSTPAERRSGVTSIELLT